MVITEIKEFHINKIVDEPDKTPSILVENGETNKCVEVLGKILEAQYRIGSDFLLLVTEGNPIEEALYIYYLNSNLKVKDSLELSAMYAEGMLRNLSIVEPSRVTFSFFENDEKWVLEILQSPKFTLLDNRHPVKKRGSIFQKGWLRLKKRND